MPDDPFKLSHATVRYGKGHAPEFCHTCRHYEKPKPATAAPHCNLVSDPIEPGAWCKLWAAIPKKPAPRA